MRFAHSLVLTSLFLIVWRVNGSGISVESCPLGTAFVRGFCLPLGSGIYEAIDEAVEEQCDCAPFYKCRHEDVIQMKVKSCGVTEVCCKRDEPPEETCGWSSGGAEDATEAQYGEFPWMVAILSTNAGENWTRAELIGGGAIVHPRVVLTAAHKLRGKTASMMKCRAGEWSRTAPEPQPPQDRRVERLLTHPDYERRYTANDVTLLRLTEPFDVSVGVVRPLCVGRGPPPRADCFAMGWGQRQYEDPDYADKLKKVGVSLVASGVCWRALQAVAAERNASGARQPALHDTLRCAGGLRARDTCTGDGGSPLVCQIQVNATFVRYAAYGLAAWGLGCGADGAPGVYVDVAKLHGWIITTTQIII